MTKSLITIALIAASTYNTKAQADGLFTMYWNNISYYNPAETGGTNKIDAYYIHRQQWLNLPRNPVTHQMTFNAKLKSINSGIGGNYTYNKFGFETKQTFNLNYAYHIKFSEDNTLSFGITNGIIYRKLNANWVTPDGTPAANDPAIANAYTKDIFYNMKLGSYFKTDKLQVGIAADGFIHDYLILTAITQYSFSISNNFSLDPSLFVRTNLFGAQVIGNLLLNYKKQFWAGGGYRIGDTYILTGGVDIKEMFRIGYAYNHTTSQLQNHSNGSHEIVLAFQLK